MTTPNLGLEPLQEGQAGAFVVVNTGFDTIDARLGGGEAADGADPPALLGWTRLRSTVVELDLASTTTAAGFFPDRALVLGVSALVLADISGAASYGVGIGGGTEFGNALGIAAGSSNVGVVGPFAVYADTDVTVSPQGGAFTAGRVRLVAHWLELGVAT